jgi:hypothetical protein
MAVRQAWTTVVLGAGPVGLVAALAAARRGRTLLIAPRLPTVTDLPRIDAVPATFLTLLLEFGIHPATIGVRKQLHDARLVAWEGTEPAIIRGPAAAHIERSALEGALGDVVRQTPRIEVAHKAAATIPPAGLIIDATGRRAVSAERRIGPPEQWVARSFWHAGRFSAAAQAFRIAALPDGYAYRLGNGDRLVLGMVGRAAARPPDQVGRYLREAGAGWLLTGLPALTEMHAGRGGMTSVQWSEGGSIPRIGDAELARDTLASQGLATGVSDAVRLAAGETTPGAFWVLRQQEQRERHLSTLIAMIKRCRFRNSTAWAQYADFLATL